MAKVTIGQFIDQIEAVDTAIDKAEAVVRSLKQDREKIELRLLKRFDKADIQGAKGRRGTATVREAVFPSIADRQKFEKFVKKNDAFDLFQNRISANAWKARLEDGIKVPGVTVFKRTSVSVRKRRS